jgi:hypothetical protein
MFMNDIIFSSVCTEKNLTEVINIVENIEWRGFESIYNTYSVQRVGSLSTDNFPRYAIPSYSAPVSSH